MSNHDVKDDVLIDIIIKLVDKIQNPTLSGLIRCFIKKKFDKVPKVFNSI